VGRREDRERALELLYEAGAKGVHPADVVESLPLAPEPYAQLLATGVGDHVELLDHLIGARARGWAVERLATVDHQLLRLGAFELAFEPDQPEAVVINEAVELAKRFSTDDSPRFVNGVLAAIRDDVRDGGPWSGAAAPAALLMDMDGVIRHWANLPGVDEALGLEPGTFAEVAVGEESVRRANDGTLTHDQWRDEVAGRLAEDHGCDPAAVLAAWRDDAFELDHEVVALLRAVRGRGIPVACVSNATTKLHHDIDASGIADCFDLVVNSSEVRVMKPEPAIYLLAAQQVGVAPASCLFVDDRAANVRGALDAGVPACRFRSTARFEATLRRVHLLD
jgi:transcription antitermination factor NusB